jgi:hypothetical protein
MQGIETKVVTDLSHNLGEIYVGLSSSLGSASLGLPN